MDSQVNEDRSCIGCLMPIFLVVLLAIAKYSGTFPYSWMWVLSPIWLPIVLLIGSVIFLGILLIILLIIKAFHE